MLVLMIVKDELSYELYFICCLGYNVVVFGLEIVRFLTCLKIALCVFDKMSQWYFFCFCFLDC